MHSSRMHTARSSSRRGGGGVLSTRHSPFCGGLLVWWPSVMAFWPPSPKIITEGRLQRKATKQEGHNRRPQQKAITEGHTPQGQAPPGSRPPPPWDQARPLQQTPLGPGTPWDQAPPGREPPAARHAGIAASLWTDTHL